jgi:uncharacterized repeat protein (TIGR03843 family)
VPARQRLPPLEAVTTPVPEALVHADLVVVGRIMPASNHTFLCRLGGTGLQAVYKPVSGERPLWDFTDGTLANREYAAWCVSEALGWSVVPPTVLREGPAGSGMAQLWLDGDPSLDPVDVVAPGAVPEGFRHVLDAFDGDDRPVVLVHEDTPALRRMAVFDAVVNNTDRKGGHVLAMSDGHRWGVDHGVCFHTEDKLRTVLWGWAGEPFTAAEVDGLERVVEGLDGGLCAALEPLLTDREIEALRARCARLLSSRTFPLPAGGWPSIPWPPF